MTPAPVDPVQGGVTTLVCADTAPYPVIVMDSVGHVVEFNDAARQLLPALTREQPLQQPGWLATAHRTIEASASGSVEDASGNVQDASGSVEQRVFSAHPSVLSGGLTAWWLVEETALRSTLRQLEVERSHTRFLAQASSALLASLNLQRCMEVTARLAAEHLADAALVIAPSSARRLPVVVCDSEGNITRGAAVSRPQAVPGLAEALQGFPPVPSRWIDPALAPDWLVPDGFGPVGSVAIVPLPGHGVPAGALVLLRRAGHSAFMEPEEAFAGLFAARAGAALSAARLYGEQNTVAETLMRELLPPVLPPVPGLEIAGGYRASADEERVGGDFYDVHPSDSDCPETLVVLGDVCGKGLEAAVLTGRIRNTIRALLSMSGDHSVLLRLLNKAMLTSQHTRFATLVLASIRREGAEAVLRLTSAGHPAPLIVRRDGRVEKADTHGTLIGGLPTVIHRSVTVRLGPGETCVLFTDGITEARGGPLGDTIFGEQRLTRALAECVGMPADAVVERVQMLASQWVGDGFHDDMAVLAITMPKGAHLSAVDGTTRGRYTR